MKKYRIVALLLTMILSLGLFGCGQKENTDQLAYRTYGINCLNSGDYESAVTAFQAALDCSNTIGDLEIELCLYKAKAQVLSGDTSGALDTYTALVDVKKLPEAYLQRGNLYLATGQKDLAIADYNSAVDKSKKDYETYLSIYDSLAAYGDDSDALDFLTKAQQLSGKKATDLYYKGRIALLTEDYETARTDLEEAEAGGIIKADFYLGKVYSAQGDVTTAMSYYNAYISSEEASIDDLRELGLEELTAGNYEEAISLLESALSMLGQPDATISPALTVAYESTLDFDSAYRVLKDYCEVYPDDESAARDLTFLETRRSDAESTTEESGEEEASTEETTETEETPSEE